MFFHRGIAKHQHPRSQFLLVVNNLIYVARKRAIVYSFFTVFGLVLPVRADLTTSFQGSTLDANLHLDVPDPAVGTISLDTQNHNLLFTGAGADLWDIRNGLPYAWTAIPQVGIGGVWRAETEVQFNDAQSDVRIAGLTTYSGPDGSGGASMGQQFTFALDQWDGPNGVWVQGLGNNHPGNSDNLCAGLDTNTVDLRMDVTVGLANDNTYNFYYKLPTDSVWRSLGTIQDVNSNDRVALFLKGGDMDVSFNYFNVTTISSVPEPSSGALGALGGMGLLWMLRRRR
ncbi:MAG: PEP-CTERM sorting domain-containing protein [Verrucomicrobiota bacterium]